MSEDKIRDFEEKISFLEHQVDELKNHQSMQQKTIFDLEKKCELLERTLKQMLSRLHDSEPE